MRTERTERLKNEVSYSATRSQGPGGQNVNKVNTRIELRFNIKSSNVLTDSEKSQLIKVLHNKITADSDLLVIEQGSRSQWQNKETATIRFINIIDSALKPVKKRRATKPTRGSIEKRLENKRRHAQKKRLRGKDDY